MRDHQVCDECREALEKEVRGLLRKTPKLSAPGLLGTRFEHLSCLRDDERAFDLLVRAIVAIALAEIPDPVLQVLKTGEVVALDKNGSDVRPLLMASSLRRIGLRALVRARRQQLAEAVGPYQYGVGRSNGALLLYER